ncbi:MAG: ABC transporter ATP-binding protein [Rhodospirillales bacterium]
MTEAGDDYVDTLAEGRTQVVSMLDQMRKAIELADRSTLWQTGLLAIMVLIGTALEAISIGLIFPFINLIANPAKLDTLPWIGEVIPESLSVADDRLLVFLTCAILTIFVIKNAVLFVVYFVQTRFSIKNQAFLARRLFERYLKSPFTLHLSRNSSDMINNVFGAVNSVFADVFIGFVTLATETLMIITLGVILFFANPILAGAAIIYVGVAVALFFFVFRKRIVYWGERELTSIRDCLQSLQQGFHSIKEVKALGREDFVLRGFMKARMELAHYLFLKGMLSLSPRLWIETIMVFGTLLAVLFILLEGADRANLIASLALFGAAGIRVIPSMNRILLAINRIKTGSYALQTVHRDMRQIEIERINDQTTSQPSPKFDILRIENVSFTYPESHETVLHNIDFEIKHGDFIGLVGPSGAGKTTLADIILGLLPATEGRVLANGRNINTMPQQWKRVVGYVPQANYLLDDTLAHNIAFGVDDIDWQRIDEVVKMAQLDQHVCKLPEGIHTNVGEHGVRLSGGQRQRVGIARALYLNPDILVLDEATSSLDNDTEREINMAIERLSGRKTLIVIAHRLSTVRNADKVILLENGRIIDSGPFENLSMHNATFRRMVELSQL